MRFGSVCSGIEAASQAWNPLGWKASWFSEIEPFPCALLAHHYPETPNLGDMTKFESWPDDEQHAIELLCGGTPCFVGSTLIATQRGLIPISDVVVGDMALTHRNKWQRVLAIGSKDSNTVLVRGQGQSTGIETTAEHPFYARTKSRVWVGRKNGSYQSKLGEPTWVEAGKMQGQMWASPATWPSSSAPSIEPEGREHAAPPMSAALAWVIGRWIGDGWCRINQRRGYVIICCGKHESTELSERITASGLAFSRSEERTTTRFQIANRATAKWLVTHFGSGAANKTIPTWAFGWNLRASLLDGYLSADGCSTSNGIRLTTVSSALALGTTLLAHSLGKSATRRLVHTNRTAPQIEGRTVSERPFWQVSIYDKSRSSAELDGHRWGLVRHVSAHGRARVYNLEVDGDNSYVADGIVVHNCQSFSIAGLREGLDDPRGNLMLTFGAIAAKYRPKWVVWENVPGVLSSNEGRDFASFLGLLSGQSITPPQDGWGKSGIIGGYANAYGLAYRVFDAQYFGVAQRRKRVFVVGYLGDWRRATAALFEWHSLSGNPAPSREKEKTTATSAGKSSFDGGTRGGSDTETAAHQTAGIRAEHPKAETPAIPDTNGTLEASLGRSRGAGTPISSIIPTVIDRAAFNQSENAMYEPLIEQSETMPTIVARGPHAVLQGAAQMVAFGEYVDDETASTLKQRDYKDATDLVTYGIPGNWIGRSPENGGNAVEPMVNIAPCLTKTDQHGVAAYGLAGNTIGRKPENGGNGDGFNEELSYTLTKTDQHGDHAPVARAPATLHPVVVGALACNTGPNGHDAGNFACNQAVDAGHVIVSPIAYAFDSLASNSMKSSNPDSGCNVVDIAKTIDTTRPDPSKNQGGNAILQPIAWSEELTPSINCASTMQRGGQGGRHEGVMTTEMQVRRLTAIECERLQGFNDGYTNIPWRTFQEASKKGVSYEALLHSRGMTLRGPSIEECPDGPRYKSLGNSWAVPNARWVGRRIQLVEDLMREEKSS
jgi:site-specific DNA-cytosine methylase